MAGKLNINSEGRTGSLGKLSYWFCSIWFFLTDKVLKLVFVAYSTPIARLFDLWRFCYWLLLPIIWYFSFMIARSWLTSLFKTKSSVLSFYYLLEWSFCFYSFLDRGSYSNGEFKSFLLADFYILWIKSSWSRSSPVYLLFVESDILED